LDVFYLKTKLIHHINELKNSGNSIGFVPTMGALHQGHLSLIETALKHTDLVVVSIFVNPTQFDNQQDLLKYPRTLEADLELLKSLNDKKIMVYAPLTEDIYDDNITSETFHFAGLEHEMEGAFRSGHFDGVGTIVKRLFEIVQPDFAFFGEKDYQQLQIVRKLVEQHSLPVKIVGCPIYRHSDGLAMSSRNERLSKEHREVAPFIYKTLKDIREQFGTKSAKDIAEWVKKQFETQPLLNLEYFVIADSKTLKPIKRKSRQKAYRAFVAVYAGDIRLIDNIALN
jgi:pantoate--beta-alanine ligase